MGTQLGDMIESEEISLLGLTDKKLVIDAYNILYQFLTTIRQRDGTPLMDSEGNITSHLSGLFFRTIKLMNNNLKLAFVFDGKPPELKQEERDRRRELKQDAQRKYELAVEKGDLELMRKYASRTSVLTKEMVEESKQLLSVLGIPVIQAPSEGEAQAAHMVKKGEFYALVSQDTDGLLFGSPRIIKNLSITGRRKKTGTSVYESINPEIVYLEKNLDKLNIDRDQLIVIAMLCGTDFNVGGIKGIGPKTSLKLIEKHGQNFDALFKEAEWDKHFDYSWEEIFEIIKDMPHTNKYDLIWGKIEKDKIRELLVEKHDFSEKRINNALEELEKQKKQKGLSDFF